MRQEVRVNDLLKLKNICYEDYEYQAIYNVSGIDRKILWKF